MKTFEEYDIKYKSFLGNDEFLEMEEYFLELINLDELEIKFNFKIESIKDIMYYFYKDICLIENDKNKKIGINKELIFDKIKDNIHDIRNVDYKYTITMNTIEQLIKKHLNLGNVIIHNLYDYHIYEIEKTLTK